MTRLASLGTFLLLLITSDAVPVHDENPLICWMTTDAPGLQEVLEPIPLSPAELQTSHPTLPNPVVPTAVVLATSPPNPTYIAPNLGDHMNPESKSKWAADLDESRSKKRTTGSSFLIDTNQVSGNLHGLSEHMSSFGSTHHQVQSFTKDNPHIKEGEVRMSKHAKLGQHSTPITNQRHQEVLSCIDEAGSFNFHQGVFHIEDPSPMDTLRIQTIVSMIGNPGKSLLIYEDYLKCTLSHYASIIYAPKEGTDEPKVDQNVIFKIYNDSKATRKNHKDKLVNTILSKKGWWKAFYEKKAGIRINNLNLTDKLGFGMESVEIFLIMFLIQVDIFSTIVVKREPLSLKRGVTHNKNSDILKRAAESFKSIYQTFWNEEKNKLHKKFNPSLNHKESRVLAVKIVMKLFQMWIKGARNENHPRIPQILFHVNVKEKPFLSFFEDISLYTFRSLDESISKFKFPQFANVFNLAPV
jgi:hypothetical protein